MTNNRHTEHKLDRITSWMMQPLQRLDRVTKLLHPVWIRFLHNSRQCRSRYEWLMLRQEDMAEEMRQPCHDLTFQMNMYRKQQEVAQQDVLAQQARLRSGLDGCCVPRKISVTTNFLSSADRVVWISQDKALPSQSACLDVGERFRNLTALLQVPRNTLCRRQFRFVDVHSQRHVQEQDQGAHCTWSRPGRLSSCDFIARGICVGLVL